MVNFEYTIKDPMGLHARPAGVMVKLIRDVPAQISLACGSRSTDGKKLFGIMGMAVKCGETVTVTVSGEDEEAVGETLKNFFIENY
jgi:Phosphotransferase System HPr (HPr) Family